ncbi:hypothetical protein [Halorubrum sp. DTA98]|uniref:hypothetical protein n=1 Tax=Halorubrum sp. DTA98 TaxID=3402163 RepID=UPI003AB0787B
MGLPLPDASEWMLQDTPLTRSTLDCLRRRGLVELVERERYRPARKTTKATNQAVYRTKRDKDVYSTIEGYTNVPRETAQAFAARPEADLYIVEVFASPDSVAASDLPRICDEYDLDVHLVGVGVENTDPSEYPGTYLPVDRGELLDVQSRLWWLLPDKPDALVFSHPSMDEGLFTDALSSPAIGDPPWVPTPRPSTQFDPWMDALFRDEWLASRRRESANGTDQTASIVEAQGKLVNATSEEDARSDRKSGCARPGQSSLTDF